MPKEIDGKDADYWYGDGGAHFRAKDYPKVIESYENAIKLGLKDKQQLRMALYNTGSAYLSLENYQKAYETYKKLVKVDSSFVLAWYGVGFSSYHLKNYKEAIKSLEKSLKVDPKTPNVRPNYEAVFRIMGDSYKELQNSPKAIEFYNQVLEINPNNEQAKEGLKSLE